MGVCTNKPGVMASVVLKQLDIEHYFSAVTAGDSFTYCKPDPRHVFKTLALMNCNPQESIFVGDSQTDIKSANNAGMQSIWVSYGYHNNEPFVVEPTYKIHKSQDILKCVQAELHEV